MQLGLFIRRELYTSARRGTVFPDRVAAVIVAAAVVACCVLFWDRMGWERTTIVATARFGLATFGVVMVILAVVAMAIVSREVASSIASERDRKSLDALLTTQLTSAEIVLGVMVAGLLRSANWLAAMLPVVVLIAIAGGVQPPLVMLTAVAVGSSRLAAGAIAIVASVYAPNRAKATAVGIGLLVCWLDIPIISEFLQPRVWPDIPRWLLHSLHSVVDSSPPGVGMGTFEPMLVPRPFGLIEAILRMIAIQICGGSLLVLWAITQLRPASRALYDGDWPAHARWISQAIQRRPRLRRPCGDDPLLWNELHSLHASSLAGRVMARVGQLLGIGALVLGTSWFAHPAFTELAQRGYGATREGFATPAINPLARVFIGKLLIPAGTTPRGQARLEFNAALRQFSSLLVMLYVVMNYGTAAMSIIQERERDTWQSVLATSLSPWEILRAKMLAALWRARGAGLILIALWAVGLAAGAVHPLGFLNAVAGLIAIGAFYAAAGACLSLRIGERKQTNNLIVLVVLCALPLSGLAILLPGAASVFLGACSTPFLIWSSLFSYEDVRAAIHSGVLPQLGATSIQPGVSARMVLAACWFATIAHAVGAVILTRMTCRRFDALVGRPIRSRNARLAVAQFNSAAK